MTVSWCAWLPWEVADQAVVRTAVQDIVESWTADWFAVRPFGAPDWRTAREAVPTPAATSGEWIRRAEGVALHLPAAVRQDLVEHSLQLDPHQPELTEADQQLLASFGKRLVQNLVDRFDERLARMSETASTGGKGYLELTLPLQASRQNLRLYLPSKAVIALHREARPLKAGGGKLTAMTAALANTPVPVRAFLGTATVSLDELRHLSPGDTLVLATPLAGLLPVTAGAANALLANAELLQDGGRPVLLLNP